MPLVLPVAEDDLQDRTTPLWTDAVDHAAAIAAELRSARNAPMAGADSGAATDSGSSSSVLTAEADFIASSKFTDEAETKPQRVTPVSARVTVLASTFTDEEETLSQYITADSSRITPESAKAADPSPLLNVDAPEEVVGQTIAGRYRIVDLLARGGMGAVYLAEHVMLRAPVALKLLRAEAQRLPELSERFHREAMVGAHVRHPNIAAATDFGQLPDGSYFLVLELVEGITLENTLRAGPLPVRRAATIAFQIAEALTALHHSGVVHRDLKPSNVMLVGRGPVARGREMVKIIDFGFAKLDPARIPLPNPDAGRRAERLTSAGVIMGTLPYLAPEAGLGMDAVDARSDLYALGVILYRMLSGQHPFTWSSETELFQKHAKEPPPRFRDRAPALEIPEDLELVVQTLLQKNPLQRYADAAAVAQALAPFAEGLADSSSPRELNALRAAVPISDTPLSSTPPTPRSNQASVPGPENAPGVMFRQICLAVSVGLVAVAGAFAWKNAGSRAADGAAVASPEGPTGQPIPAQSASSPGAEESQRSAPSAPGSPMGSDGTEASLGQAPESGAALAASVSPSTSASSSPSADIGHTRFFFSQAVKRQSWLEAYINFVVIAREDPEFLRKEANKNAASNLMVALTHAGIPEGQEMANLLSRNLGAVGADILLHVVLFRGGSKAHRVATELLRDPKVLAHATASTAITFRLQDAGCKFADDLAQDSTTEGDGRTLAVLGSQRQRCMNDPLREKAFRKLEERLSPPR